ncbi:hypothetical protein OCV51_09125 [Faecalicatena acetigenes]|uniref:Cell division protein FtsL n=1 Tax=Faecalicatena acetigenes TaxID=2981790 RepID=A0ABT2TC00_9FIRM|nr:MULTISPECIES: hypothetical protein [Lachnospiraceae]MCU6747810.1 hypothetical protein [Faecalicatena acetigenes]SCI10025.1 Uncharacterised protein [uncultured Clostridium sp.]
MAAVRRRPNSYRHHGYAGGNQRAFYVYGNTVRQAEVLPKKETREHSGSTRKTSRQVKRNRNRALNMSPAYVGFLVAAAFCAVFVCMLYLQLQSDIVSRSENITALQQELADLTEANDTAYNAATDSVNLEEVRSKAMNELGMVYAAQGTVIEYDSPTSDYVKQYSDIPKDGVLAQSKNVKE